jgi:hypothetical protein
MYLYLTHLTGALGNPDAVAATCPPTVVVRRTPAPPAPPPAACANNRTHCRQRCDPGAGSSTPNYPCAIASVPQAPPRAATPVIPEIIAPPPLPPPPVVVQVPPSPAPPQHAVVQVVSNRPRTSKSTQELLPLNQRNWFPNQYMSRRHLSQFLQPLCRSVWSGPLRLTPFIVVRNPRPQRPEVTQLAQPVAPPEERPLTVIAPISEPGHEQIDGGVPEGMPSATQIQGQTPSIATVSSPESVIRPCRLRLSHLLSFHHRRPWSKFLEASCRTERSCGFLILSLLFRSNRWKLLLHRLPLLRWLPPVYRHPPVYPQLQSRRGRSAPWRTPNHSPAYSGTAPYATCPEPSNELVVEPEPVPVVPPRDPSPPVPAVTPQWKPALVTVPSHRTPSRATARVKSRDGTTSTEPRTKPFEFRPPHKDKLQQFAFMGRSRSIHRLSFKSAHLRALQLFVRLDDPRPLLPPGKPVSMIAEEPEQALSWTPVPGGEDMPAQDHPGMGSPSRPSPHLSYMSGAPLIHSPRPVSALVGGAVPALEQVADLQEEERIRQQEFERFVEEQRNFMAQQREMMHRMVLSAATAEQVAQQTEEDHHSLSQAIQDVQADAQEQRKSVEENIIGIVSQDRADELERERQRVRDLEAELEQLTREMEEETGRQEEDKCEQARIEAAAHDEEIRGILGDITNRLDMANAEKDEWERMENERWAQKDEQRNVKASHMERLEEMMGRIIQEQSRSMALAQEERDRRNQQPGYAEIIEHLRQTNQRQQDLLNELLNCK